MTTDDNSNDESDFDAEAFLDKLRDDPAFRDEVRDILGQTPSSSRRALLKGAGTALGAGALVGGAGTAAADPQGEVGTSSNPVDQVYVNTLTMSGSSRDIESAGTVNADTGNFSGLSMNGGDITNAGTVNADTGNLSGLSMNGSDISNAGTVNADTGNLSGLSMAGDVDMGNNTIKSVGELDMRTGTETENDIVNVQNLDTDIISVSNRAEIDKLSMAGNVNMGGNDIVSGGTVSATDAELGGLSMGGNIDLGGNDLASPSFVGSMAVPDPSDDSFKIISNGSTFYVPLYNSQGSLIG